MRIGVIGGGIVGTAIASTLKKHSPTSIVTIIDDNRPNQTSKAGQGFLWSIHRTIDTDLQLSIDAKEAWIDLLGLDDFDRFTDPSGSLLIASDETRKEELWNHYQKHESVNLLPNLQWYDSASSINAFVRPEVCGLYYPHDYTCVPSKVIEYLMSSYDLKVEHRTVCDIGVEKDAFDAIVCCAGPWINSLRSVGVIPIRGLLLEVDHNSCKSKSVVPMMEYGYGGMGFHFTLSSRDDQWLVGASRENVGFDVDENLVHTETALLRHASEFILPGVIGTVLKQNVGFRPSCNGDEAFIIDASAENREFFVYGFEGQGVLYAALAAKRVSKLLFDH